MFQLIDIKQNSWQIFYIGVNLEYISNRINNSTRLLSYYLYLYSCNGLIKFVLNVLIKLNTRRISLPLAPSIFFNNFKMSYSVVHYKYFLKLKNYLKEW